MLFSEGVPYTWSSPIYIWSSFYLKNLHKQGNCKWSLFTLSPTGYKGKESSQFFPINDGLEHVYNVWSNMASYFLRHQVVGLYLLKVKYIYICNASAVVHSRKIHTCMLKNMKKKNSYFA